MEENVYLQLVGMVAVLKLTLKNTRRQSGFYQSLQHITNLEDEVRRMEKILESEEMKTTISREL